jgi:hypothetical protein
MKLIKTAVLSLGILSGAVPADDFFIDRFEITRNGSAEWFVDEFDDGLVPPSSEGTFPDGSAGSYRTRPDPLVGPEQSGKLLINPQLGTSSDPNDPDGPVLIQRARLLTDATDNPANSELGLKVDMTFDVIGTFDLVKPKAVGARYGIRISDFGVATPNDVIQLRIESWPGNEWLLRFFETGADESAATEFDRVDLDRVADDLQGVDDIQQYDQVVLTLTKADAGSAAISASFSLVDTDGVLATHTQELVGAPNGFDGETWTRASFFASVSRGPSPFTALPPLITPILLGD